MLNLVENKSYKLLVIIAMHNENNRFDHTYQIQEKMETYQNLNLINNIIYNKVLPSKEYRL